ncbi:MAG: lysophospholipid acyltransferase family protein [Bacteroidia bacterium]
MPAFIKYLLLIPYWIWLILVFICFLVSSGVLSTLFIVVLGKKAHRPTMTLYKFWSTVFFIAAGIRVIQKDRHILSKNLPAIVVGNHGSNLDMFIGAFCMPTNIKPLAKVQLKKMPILGYLFSTVCVLVDRSSKESRDKSSRAMMAEILAGNSLFIYPEGTRNKGNQPVNDFYDGAFRFAIESKRPLVAMCTINARNLVPSENYSVKPGVITVQYLGPYETKNLEKEDLTKLKQRIHRDMFEAIRKGDPMFD